MLSLSIYRLDIRLRGFYRWLYTTHYVVTDDTIIGTIMGTSLKGPRANPEANQSATEVRTDC